MRPYRLTDEQLKTSNPALLISRTEMHITSPAMQQALDELRQIMDEYLRQKEEEDLVTQSGVEV